MRPTCFRIPYVTAQHVPYGPGDTPCKDQYVDGGVLAKGQTVWLKSPHDEGSGEIIVPAFVEHLGVVALDMRFLVDLSQHVTRLLKKWHGPKPALDEEEHKDSSSAAK